MIFVTALQTELKRGERDAKALQIYLLSDGGFLCQAVLHPMPDDIGAAHMHRRE